MSDPRQQVERYLSLNDRERERLRPIVAFLDGTPRELWGRRSTPAGHLTASAFCFDPTTRQFVLLWHTFLRCWLQPGGHLESDELPFDAAMREAKEEIGLSREQLRLIDPRSMGLPLDIDSHSIPANAAKSEGPHVHHDFGYLFAFDSTAPLHAPEGHELKLFSLDAFALEPRFQIIAEKVRAIL